MNRATAVRWRRQRLADVSLDWTRWHLLDRGSPFGQYTRCGRKPSFIQETAAEARLIPESARCRSCHEWPDFTANPNIIMGPR